MNVALHSIYRMCNNIVNIDTYPYYTEILFLYCVLSVSKLDVTIILSSILS